METLEIKLSWDLLQFKAFNFKQHGISGPLKQRFSEIFSSFLKKIPFKDRIINFDSIDIDNDPFIEWPDQQFNFAFWEDFLNDSLSIVSLSSAPLSLTVEDFKL